MTLQDLLRKRIQQEGPIPLDIFQQWALSHPQKGYYTTQAVLGQKGDFITAPEVSQMFGEMVGLWLLDLWHQMGSPAPIQLMELGPGRGLFMADMLRVGQLDPGFFKALSVHLVEINPLLQKEQQQRLSSFAISVTSSSTVEEALRNQAGPLLVVANEFFDALPIKQFEKKEKLWWERYVGWCEEIQSFCITLRKTQETLTQEGIEGDIWEMSPQREGLFRELLQHLQKRQGVMWIADYGYASPQALGDSLQGLYHQQKSDPLAHVGETDLSSHVNFGRFQEILQASGPGLTDRGPKGQGAFLKALGIEQRLIQLKQGKSFEQAARLQAEFERLTHRLQMGDLFQIYTVYAPPTLDPAGF